MAIEILNTHAVDFDKQQWLERQRYSALEIYVADIERLQPDQIYEALEARLFQTSDHSIWLTHARDIEARLTLDQLEEQIRTARSAEEQALLTRLDAEEANQKRKDEAHERFRDIEDFKLGLGSCTVRVGRNKQRVSLKIHGYASDEVFEEVKQLGRKNNGHFNNRARCWEFHRHSENEAFFRKLCAEVKQECLERYLGVSLSPFIPQRVTSSPVEVPIEQPLPIYFEDPAQQEAFDERAAILEFEAGLERESAEKQALAEITAALPNHAR